uniref:Ig-like domain-containing protein n=1 Tax=Chelydra serpentina TaxID=8475 RepID=A0A8C3ST91_CHESE
MVQPHFHRFFCLAPFFLQLLCTAKLSSLSCPQSASPSAPSVSGPLSRADPGPPVTFTCMSGGFSPRNITVTWLKNGARLPAPQTQVLPEHENVSYSVSSTVGVSLTPGDARSQLTCQIEHSTLPAPLHGTYHLRDALRGRSPAGADPWGLWGLRRTHYPLGRV